MSQQSSAQVVGEASNGIQALEMCEKLKPDVVLMDLNMPVMNGVDAIRNVKQRFPWIKVIALTVLTEFAYVKSVLKLGAEGYLSKNSDTEELYLAIETVHQGDQFLGKDVQKILLQNALDEDPANKRLTARELEIIELISRGLTSLEIAKQLHLNVKTIESHRRNIFRKTNVKNSIELIRIALERGLILK